MTNNSSSHRSNPRQRNGERPRRSEQLLVDLSGILLASGAAMLLGAVAGAIKATNLQPGDLPTHHAVGIAATSALMGVFLSLLSPHHPRLLPAHRWAVGSIGAAVLIIGAGAVAVYSLQGSMTTSLAWTLVAIGGLQLLAPVLTINDHAGPSSMTFHPSLSPVARVTSIGVALVVPFPVVWAIVSSSAVP